jgi:hypothetical protein
MYVVFRVDPPGEGGDVFALFPETPGGAYGEDFCMSYQDLGGHAAADYQGCVARSRPARPDEYTPMLARLSEMGYEGLVVRERATREMHERRRREAAEGR